MTSPKETQDLLFSPVIDSDSNDNGKFETLNKQNGSNSRNTDSMNRKKILELH